MSTDSNMFDKAAASWDENPARVKLAADIARTISEQIALTPAMDVLDFGCGTGLLTLNLQPHVRSVTGVDTSRGMLDVLEAKIASQNLTNVTTALFDPADENLPDGTYHLITTNMTFHHIKEIEPIIARFYRLAAPSGYLCIADLDLDDGQFHGSDDDVFHFGFDRSKLRGMLINSGFDEVRDTTAAEITKPDREGNMRRFTVFLLTGRKHL